MRNEKDKKANVKVKLEFKMKLGKLDTKKLALAKEEASKKAKFLSDKIKNARKRAAALDKKVKSAPPKIKEAILKKKADLIEKVQNLKKSLKKTKEKISQIKETIRKSPKESCLPFIIEKKQLVASRDKIKAKIKRAEKHVILMKAKFREKCLAKTKKLYKDIKAKIEGLKKEIKQIKQKIKKAPAKDKKPLEKTLDQKLKELKELTMKMKIARNVKTKAKAKINKGTIKKYEKNVKGLLKKYKAIQKKILKLRGEIAAKKEKLKDSNKDLQAEKAGSAAQNKLQAKITQLTKKIELLESKLNKLIPIKTQTKTKLKAAIIKLNQIKIAFKKQKADSECKKLQKQLKTELEAAKKLKEKFRRECQKALKVVTNAHIEKIARIQRKMKILQKRITIIKQKIIQAPKQHKIALKAEVKKIKAELKIQKKILQTVLGKIATVMCQEKAAPAEQKKTIEAKKQTLEKKVKKIKEKMKATKKDYLLLKLKYKKECDEQIKKEKNLARVYLEDLGAKLKIINERADKYKESIEMANKELKLREKAEKLELKINVAPTKEKKKYIRSCINEAIQKAQELQKKQEEAKKEAEELKKDYEKKEQEVLGKERDGALLKGKLLQRELELAKIKQQKIAKAISQAKDKRVKDALMEQQNKANVEAAKVLSKVNLMSDKAKVLKQEISLRKEAISTEEREKRLKEIKMEKDQQDRLTRLKMRWEGEVNTDLEESIKQLQAMYTKKIAQIKKEIARAQADKASYGEKSKKQFETERKSKILEVDSEWKTKIEKIMNKIQKVKADNHAFKLKAEESLDKKLKQISEKMTKQTVRKVMVLNQKLRMVKGQYERQLKSVTINLKGKYLKEKAMCEEKITEAKTRLTALKADALREIAKLKARLQKERSKAAEFKASLDTAKDASGIIDNKFEKVKKDLAAENYGKINKKMEDDKVLIAKTQAKLAKMNKEFLDKKTDLNTELETMKKEAKSLALTISSNKAKYAELQDKYKATKAEIKKAYNERIAIEQKSLKDIQKKMEAGLSDCQEKLKEIKAKVKKITEESKAQIKDIKELTDKKEKRTKAAALFKREKKDLADQLADIKTAEETRRKTCEMGTPGGELKVLCTKLKRTSRSLQKKQRKLKRLLMDTERSLMTFNVTYGIIHSIENICDIY